ncbi:MAG: sugar phosphate isomerase/epimerase family protein [Abditibacteriales bacterium]|nr:sugar phosphate isomerase/epimerase family protein [Abditibacteriales bacterium]
MKYGIRDGLLGRDLTWQQRFELAKEIGFDGIEITVGENYREHPLWNREGVENFKRLAQATGVAVSSLSPGFWQSRGFHTDNRAEGQAVLEYLIPVCRELGAEVILVPFFGNHQLTSEDVHNQNLIEGFQNLAPLASEHHVKLALECTLNAADLSHLMEHIGSAFVGVYYDVGNATHFGYNPAEEIRTLGKHIFMIHSKDTDGKMLGEGTVNFPACRESIRAIGYEGWIVLETPMGENPAEAARRNLQFTRENL